MYLTEFWQKYFKYFLKSKVREQSLDVKCSKTLSMKKKIEGTNLSCSFHIISFFFCFLQWNFWNFEKKIYYPLFSYYNDTQIVYVIHARTEAATRNM